MILVVLLVVGISALIYTLTNRSKITIENDKKTADALAQARAALIGYAASVDTTSGSARPGELPCPNRTTLADGTPSGIATTPCNSLSTRVGWLPWKTLGLPPLRDGSSELLWYAVSDTFKNSSRTGILNSDTAGDFTITGTTSATNVIAVVFAPGGAVSGQLRDTTVAACSTTGGTSISRRLCAANYLEGANADAADTALETQATSDSFNDQLMPITSNALFSVVNIRVAKEAMTALNTYRATNTYYPFANAYGSASPYNCSTSLNRGRFPITTTACGNANWPAGALPSWFTNNNWNLVTHYAMSKACGQLGLGTVTIVFFTIDLDSLVMGVCDTLGNMSTVIGLINLFFPSLTDDPVTVPGVSNNVKALVIVTGQAMGAQVHPCADAGNCMEDAANTDGDAVYTKPSRYPTSNDRMAVTCASPTCNTIP